MRSENARYLVETDWLEAHLDDSDLRVFDCTVHIRPGAEGLSLKSRREGWSEAHTPGSGFADLVDDLSDPNHPVPLMMPPAEQFAEQPKYPRGNFVTRQRPELIATKQDVLAAIDDENCRLVNALTAAEHQGRLAFYGRPGHIPSSVNVPARSMVDRKTHAYLPEERLLAMFSDAGATSRDRVIVSCGGGVASSSDAFILTLLGVEDVAVYDGSLLEWAPDLSLPVEI